jgi:hypothetical protein
LTTPLGRSYVARRVGPSEEIVRILQFLIATLVATLVACNPDQGFTPGNNDGTGDDPGQISGRICDPSGRTWLADAMAYTNIIVDGQLTGTRVAYSDRDGFWLLDDLPGDEYYQVFVQHGSEILFDQEVYVTAGQTTQLDEPDCFDPLELKVAIVTGDYDDFQLVLQQMGFANYTVFDGLVTGTNVCDICEDNLRNFLLDAEWMQQFDIIMMNGGHVEENIIYPPDPESDTPDNGDSEVIMANIVGFVQGGGSIYASDWAYDDVEVGWPNRIDFLGDDAEPNSAQAGDQQIVNAAISDSALAAWLGSKDSRVDVEYDLPVWPAIAEVDPSASVHLEGSVDVRMGTYTDTINASPLLTSFNDGEGKVVYATFRVAKNASADMLLILQYMMYQL